MVVTGLDVAVTGTDVVVVSGRRLDVMVTGLNDEVTCCKVPQADGS